jgi:MerR family transcriptional regulator, light-induced transcriptional regulator
MDKPLNAIRDFLIDHQDDFARMIVERQWKLNPALELRYGKKGQAKCFADARYHLQYLSEAVGAAEPALFVDYVSWAKTMLGSRNIPVHDLVANLEAVHDVLQEKLPFPMHIAVLNHVKAGMRELVLATEPRSLLDPDQPFAELANQYLSSLLRYERHVASDLILHAVENNASIKQIYFHVFERCQHEIGRLWQSNLLSVAQEHYCTTATQLTMSQLYPYIFRANRISRGTIVAACVPGELHEIGARMLCDLLEIRCSPLLPKD